MTLTSIPTPVVTWETIVSTNDPTREPSRAQIRTLRKNGLVSDGLQVPTRINGKAAGSSTFHSTLFALALKAGQVGDDAGAKLLRHHAQVIEARFAERIREYLSTHRLDALVDAPFFPSLADATARALEEWGRQGSADVVFATGRVRGFVDKSVILQANYRYGSASGGESVDVDLPRSLADGSGLHQGDHVWIFRRTIGSAALLDLLPAVVMIDSDDSAPSYEGAARGLAYLNSGGGGLPTVAEAQFLRARHARTTPRRVVRPAG